MGNGNSYGEDIELKGIGALDIHEDAHVVAYLQTNEKFGWLINTQAMGPSCAKG